MFILRESFGKEILRNHMEEVYTGLMVNLTVDKETCFACIYPKYE